MLYAQNLKSSTKSTRQTIVGVLVMFVLIAVAVVTSSILSPPSMASKFDVRGERSNHRIRVPGDAARATARSAALPVPFVTISVDRTDDTAAASACTGAANDCSLRGAVAFANLNPGTTISVPAGTYQLNIAGGAGEGFSGNNSIGDLDVRGNNTIITGAGAATTIIQQTQPNDRVLEVNPDLLANFNFSISDVTITGGKETTAVGGGGIISGAIDNTMTVTNCVFSNNSATGVGTFGGGGISHAGGSLTITGTTFSNNSTSGSGGGLGYTAGDPLIRTPSTGTLSISGSTFSGNSANSAAAGGGGADLFNFNLGSGTYNINSTSFSSNTAPNGRGGAIVVESGPLTLTTSSLTTNSAGVAGGAIHSGSSTSVTFSRLVGNTVPNPLNGLTIFVSSGVASADDNWWGINTGPSANDFRNTAGTIFPLSYLKLRVSASPNPICPGGTSTLTADIKERNSGSALTTELNGLPTFPAIFNNAVLGTLSGATNFVNGVATATYTAGGTTGMGSADVTADNQTVTATILISGGVPVITLSKTTDTMWPPNHQYHTFNVTDFVASASSGCDANVDINDVVIQKVSSDEPEENPLGADGNTLNDIVIAPDCKSVQLRAERDSNLNGRVYTITFKVTDAFGNSTTATVTVTVPINNAGTAVDNGPAAGYTVNSLCP